jgi:hypothetical protein
VSVSSRPGDAHPGRPQVRRHRGSQLADRHRHGAGPWARDSQYRDRDALGQVLEQIGVGAGDDGRDNLGDGSVVDRVAQGVALAGRAEVGVDVEVDLERLGPGALFGQGTVGPDGPQAS